MAKSSPTRLIRSRNLPTRAACSHAIVAPLTRPEPAWTPREVVIYLATLAPFVLLFVGAAIGWTIAPLEHLRPTPQNVAAGAATLIFGLLIVRWRWGTRHVVRWSSTVVPEFEQVLSSPLDARVVKILKSPGAALAKGEPILTLDVSQAVLTLDRINQQIETKQNSPVRNVTRGLLTTVSNRIKLH